MTLDYRTGHGGEMRQTFFHQGQEVPGSGSPCHAADHGTRLCPSQTLPEKWTQNPALLSMRVFLNQNLKETLHLLGKGPGNVS